MMRTGVLFLCASIALAQQPAAAPVRNDDGGVKFTSTSQLVVETVSVKDRGGNPVEGLTAKDFVVTEDGVLQTIRFFEFQKLPEVVSFTVPHNLRSRRVMDAIGLTRDESDDFDHPLLPSGSLLRRHVRGLALAQEVQDFLADHVQAEAEVLQHARGHTLFLADQAQQQVLGADVRVAHVLGFFDGVL